MSILHLLILLYCLFLNIYEGNYAMTVLLFLAFLKLAALNGLELPKPLSYIF